jgi:hypothetical protein
VDASGDWQVIELPVNWMRRYFKDSKAREVSVALLGPNPQEIGADNAPCGPRQSVQLIATGQTGKSQTAVLLDGAFCSQEWHPPAGLEWATGAHLRIMGISVAVTPEGNLTLTYRVARRDSPHGAAGESDPQRTGNWDRRISLKEIQELINRL